MASADHRLAAFLSDRFCADLPGAQAQMPLEPPMSYGRHRGPAPDYARRAAVLLLMMETDQGLSVPMIKRRDDLVYHPGEMAFPGGGLEQGESWEEAALRECREEIGIAESSIQTFGYLTPIYVFGSLNLVMPVVAVGKRPIDYVVDLAEVERVVDVPLTDVGLNSITSTMRPLGGIERDVPCFDVGAAQIWGASAMMLAELSVLMSDFCG